MVMSLLMFCVFPLAHMQMLSSRRVDHDYCLSMLLMSPPSDVIPQLMAAKPLSSTNYSRVIVSHKINYPCLGCPF